MLFISIHRWDAGKFYPFSGAPNECGDGPGLGCNVNIAFSENEKQSKWLITLFSSTLFQGEHQPIAFTSIGAMGDTEFVSAFYHFVLPIARQFNPDLVSNLGYGHLYYELYSHTFWYKIFVSAGFDAAEGHPENVSQKEMHTYPE